MEGSRHQRQDPGEPFVDLASADVSARDRAYATVQLTEGAVVVSDMDGVIRTWSPGAARLYGYAEADALGRRRDELLRTVFPGTPEEIAAALERDGIWEGPLLHATADGTPLMVLAYHGLQRRPDGAPNAVLQVTEPAEPVSEPFHVVPAEHPSDITVVVHRPIRDAQGRVVDLQPIYVSEEGRLQFPPLAAADPPPMGVLDPPFLESALFRILARVCETGRGEDFTDARLTPHERGEEIVLAGRAAPFGDCVAVRARDVTSERRALQVLDDAQARVRLALAIAPVAVVETDPERRVVWGTGAFAGWEAAELAGRALDEVIPEPDAHARLAAAADEAVREGRETRLHLTVPAGEMTFHADIVIAPRLRDGRPTGGLVIAAYDLSDQVAARNELELQARAMRIAAEGIAVIRIADRRIVSANARFCELFGYEPGELDDADVTVLNAPEPDVTLPIQQTIAALERGEDATLRFHNVRKDGTLLWTEARITGFEHPEHGPVWVSVQRDVSEWVAIEERVAELEGRGGGA